MHLTSASIRNPTALLRKFQCTLWLTLLLFSAPCARADVTVLPRLSLGVTYTDNVFLTTENEEYDWITTITPGVGISMVGKQSGLDIDLNASYVNYTRFSDENTWRYGVGLRGWADVTQHTQLFLNSNLSRTEDPLADPNVEDAPPDTTIRRGREPYFRSTTTVGVRNRFGDQDEIMMQYTSNILEDVDSSTDSSAYHRPQISMTYWLSPNVYALEMDGSLYKSAYENQDEADFEDWNAGVRLMRIFNRQLNAYLAYNHTLHNVLGFGEDYRVYNPEVGFSWTEQSNTQFSVSFGYWYRNLESAENDDGLTGMVNMDYAYSSNGSFSFAGGVGFDRAYFGFENLGFNPYYTVSGDLSHQLAPRTTGSLNAGYRRNLYIDEEPDREDAIWTTGAGLGYQALPWLSVNFDYRYRQVNSNVNSNDYTENRATISVSFVPERPWKW